jgi:hypothetical protein
VTGAQPIGRNAETKGWTVDSNELKFDGAGVQACPGTEGWRLWLQGLDKPGFSEGCETVTASAIKTDSPVGCWYTE